MTSDQVTLDIGDSFLIRNQYGEHLHIIVAESSPDNSAQIMLVYISSTDNTPYKDPTTIIEKKEHRFIKKRSWVRYQNIIICSRPEIKKSIFKYYGKIDDELLAKIQEGINSSNFVSIRNKQLFNQWKIDGLFRKIKKQKNKS